VGPIPGSEKRFFLSEVSRLVLGPTQPPVEWVPQIFSPGVNQPGHETDNSSPCSAQFENG